MTAISRTALVTGATGAIGQAIAAGLVALPNYEVIVVGRDVAKVGNLVARLKRSRDQARVRGEIVDVSSHRSIAELALRLEKPLDILINNAAVAPSHRHETSSGIELVFATNVLGYVWLTEALLPALQRGYLARVVNVASYWAGDLDLSDLEFKRRPYDNDIAYRQSKQANRMLTVAWAARLRPYAIAVNCCHPGDVNSKLSNDLGFGGSESLTIAAATPLWLATGGDVEGVTGCYCEQCRIAKCRFSEDRATIERLAQICDGYA